MYPGRAANCFRRAFASGMRISIRFGHYTICNAALGDLKLDRLIPIGTDRATRALLGMAFECRQTCLLQAHRVAFAATCSCPDNPSCDAGVNNGWLVVLRSNLTAPLKASPILRVISSSNEPSSGLMNGKIDATLLPSSHPETIPGKHGDD